MNEKLPSRQSIPMNKAPKNQPQSAQGVAAAQQVINSPKDYSFRRVDHQFLNKMPDINSVENDLMKLLNEFSNTKLKKYGRLHFFYFAQPYLIQLNEFNFRHKRNS